MQRGTMPQYNPEEEAGALPKVPERLLARHVAIQTFRRLNARR